MLEHSRCTRQIMLGLLLVAGLFSGAYQGVLAASAQEDASYRGTGTQEVKPKYYDIYLSGNRFCRQCMWGETTADHRVALINKKGKRGYYPIGEILGVEDHPLLRKIYFHAVHGVGRAGEVICPEAFDMRPGPVYNDETKPYL